MRYVDAGYIVTFASLAAYGAWVVRRHRTLARLLGQADPRPGRPGDEA